jgi:hypothetical protein
VQRDRNCLCGASYVTWTCKFAQALRGSSKKPSAQVPLRRPARCDPFMANHAWRQAPTSGPPQIRRWRRIARKRSGAIARALGQLIRGFKEKLYTAGKRRIRGCFAKPFLRHRTSTAALCHSAGIAAAQSCASVILVLIRTGPDSQSVHWNPPTLASVAGASCGALN